MFRNQNRNQPSRMMHLTEYVRAWLFDRQLEDQFPEMKLSD